MEIIAENIVLQRKSFGKKVGILHLFWKNRGGVLCKFILKKFSL